MPHTPTSPNGRTKHDNLPPPSAVVKAWMEPGPYPAYHNRMKQYVRNAMPLLGKALDRMGAGYEPDEPTV